MPEAAGRAYSSLVEPAPRCTGSTDSDRYYAEGIAYCEDRELGVFSMCINGWRAWPLHLLGRWDEASARLRARCWAVRASHR